MHYLDFYTNFKLGYTQGVLGYTQGIAGYAQGNNLIFTLRKA